MRTTDNNYDKDERRRGQDVNDLVETENETFNIPDLQLIANQKIKDMELEKHKNLLIFPPNDSVYGDKIGEETIFSLKGNILKTNNIMGFVGVNDTRLTITSRFVKKDDENDYFLHYMLQRVLSLNITRLDQSKKNESIWNFLPYLFPYYLKRALSQGIYKSYQTVNYNNSNVKGVIDIKRHLKFNIPFSGKIAYSSREYNVDNEITELIRHTIEEISSNRLVNQVLKNDKDTIDAVHQIISSTNAFNKNDRSKIIAKNHRAVKHPYFFKYKELQRLCKMILNHDKLSFGHEKDRIYGLIFDGAWLWEEYLNKLLHDKFIHPKSKIRKDGDHLFQDENDKPIQEIYPDFISISEPKIIADAKYKFLNKSGYDKDYGRDDYFQMLAYMLRYTSNLGLLLFPYKETYVEKEPREKVLTMKGRHTPSKTLTKLGLTIPQNAADFNKFIEDIKKSEDDIKNYIEQLAVSS